jgi:hypothetical protein
MQGFLTRIIGRRLRRLAFGAIGGMVVVTTSALAAGRFHDPHFDDADLAVEKAQLLLAAAACGNPGLKPTIECERHVKKVEDLLARARAEIMTAALAADGLTQP